MKSISFIVLLGMFSLNWVMPFNRVMAKELLVAMQFPQSPPVKESPQPEQPEMLLNWNEALKDARKIEGFFNLYYKEREEQLFMEIRPDQYNRELLCSMAIARGAGLRFLGGVTLNFGDQWLLGFHRVADRILVTRHNVRFRANHNTPQAEAVKTSYTDSVIAAVPIRSQQSEELDSPVLIDLADLFMTDLAKLGFQPDPGRSTWAKFKAFPENIVVEVNTVFSLESPFGKPSDEFFSSSGDEGIPDSRGVQVVIHYGLSALPQDEEYKPRIADDRIGHFLNVVKDFSTDIHDTAFIRYVTRWKLEKSDPKAKKSPPKEPIIFWIEKTVPREYRPYVKEGILEWNKAFERIGFIEAIQVRDQQAGDDFDPEDIRYNTFRWITTSIPFAIGPSRTNPKTGQILDADILFDESMIRALRQEYLSLAGFPQSLDLLQNGSRQGWFKLYTAEMPKLTLAEPLLNRMLSESNTFKTLWSPDKLEFSTQTRPSLLPFRQEICLLGPGIRRQLGLLAAVLQADGKIGPGDKVPEEFIGQAIKEVTMHEVGHTLGLRHNFKASTMLNQEELHNSEMVRDKGLAGSVMDYLPVNFALKGQKQGYYFTPTIGPYDYWAIEYAYKPIGDHEMEESPAPLDSETPPSDIYKPIRDHETEELARIAGRAAEPDLIYATDEDLFFNPDPRINAFDLGDPLEYAKRQTQLVEGYLKDLAERVVAEGEGWQRARDAFSLLLGELAQATYLSAQYIGSVYTHRDHRGDPNARLPFELISVARQREAMAFLVEHVLSDDAFHFSPDLLKRLAPEHWFHWGMNGFLSGYEYPLHRQILTIQRIVLSHFLDSRVLRNLQDFELFAKPGEETLKMHEVFNTLTQAIWREVSLDPLPTSVEISTIRRNLQREHYRRLAELVLGPSSELRSMDLFFLGFNPPPPPDARSLARYQLRQIDTRISKILSSGGIQIDPYSQAHLEETRDRIRKVLEASLEMIER